MNDYLEDIKIDENNLEQEWVEQPSLYLYYAEAHAEAIYQKDLSKAKLEYRYSQTYTEIKNNYQQYFDSKPTEAAIKEAIVKDPLYKKAVKLHLTASKHANVMLAAKTAFDHRRKALENLVSLKITGFYSEPKARKNVAKGGHTEQRHSLNDKGSRASSRLKRNRKKR